MQMTTFTSGVFQKETVKYFNMKNNAILVSIIVALVFGAGGFYGGIKYQQSQRVNLMTQLRNGAVGNGRFMIQNGQNGTMRGGFRPVVGQISAIDDTSMTVKLPDGSSKIVLFNDKTVINKSSEGTKNDLKTGETVSVFGTETSDGSVTAQNVQVRPSTP